MCKYYSMRESWSLLPLYCLYTALYCLGAVGCSGVCLPKQKLPARQPLSSFITPDRSTSTMDKRSGETPMDFEWQSRGPGDVTSPFYQLGLQHENKKRKCLSSRPCRTRVTLTRQD